MSGILFRAVERSNPQDSTEVAYYPNAVMRGYYGIDAICEGIAKNCMVTKHDVRGVLSSLQQHIGERLQRNQAVHLGQLGSFRLSVNCNAVKNIDEISTKNIRSLRAEFSPNAWVGQNVNVYVTNFEKKED